MVRASFRRCDTLMYHIYGTLFFLQNTTGRDVKKIISYIIRKIIWLIQIAPTLAFPISLLLLTMRVPLPVILRATVPTTTHTVDFYILILTTLGAILAAAHRSSK
jgi:hypothetical protein